MVDTQRWRGYTAEQVIADEPTYMGVDIASLYPDRTFMGMPTETISNLIPEGCTLETNLNVGERTVPIIKISKEMYKFDVEEYSKLLVLIDYIKKVFGDCYIEHIKEISWKERIENGK